MVEGPVDEINVIVTRRDSEERSGYSFRGRVIVGRDEACDLRLPDRLVSRRHAIFSRTENGSVSVRDLNSSNGTVVNGRDLHGGGGHGRGRQQSRAGALRDYGQPRR